MAVGALIAAALMAACSEAPAEPAGSGSLAGQVVVSGPLRHAQVAIDQIETRDPAMGIRAHVADTTTDDEGRFSVDVGSYSGLLLLRAAGRAFVDLSTGAAIQLDAGSGLESFAALELGEQRDDVLVSPIGHLIVTRTRSSAGAFRDAQLPVRAAEQAASEHLSRHFGNVDWTRQKLGSFAVPATSPTEAVRAALVQAAWSELAHDIATAAGASPQEVNVLTLTQQLAADLAEVAVATTTRSVQVNVTLTVVDRDSQAYTYVTFKPASAEEAFEAHVQAGVAERIAPLEAELASKLQHIDQQIDDRAEEMLAARILQRAVSLELNAHQRNADNVIVHVMRAVLVGNSGYLLFDIENRSPDAFRIASLQVRTMERALAPRVLLASQAVDREPGLIGIVAANTTASGVVVLRGIDQIAAHNLTVTISGRGDAGRIRLDRGIVLR